MYARRTVLTGLAGLTATSAAARAFPVARKLRFTSDLTGDKPPANTGSKARAGALIAVDSRAQTIDLAMSVTGIHLAQLWDKLKAAPIGPVHIHHYGSMQHMNDPSVTLVMPVPFGPNYTDNAEGFTVSLLAFPYAKGAALLGSKLPFGDFVTSMKLGLLALNVHTNAFTDGEINGPVLPA